ncbi:MAG TPA: hypothetical protein VFW95_06980 [Candidatus Limnocylindria bacterium]|nr:hypothetical protein [Candidatus Limnocylindria bacterium]
MSRPTLISYPTGWTLAVVDEPAEAEAAAAELRESGVDSADVIVIAGDGAEAGMQRLGAGSGGMARLRRAMQFLAMDQLPDFHVYELALEQGRALVAIRIGQAGARREAVDVLRRHGGHFINRFGSWATEEIAPWRGTMPNVPQHMQR